MTDIQEENGEALSENEVAAEAPTEPAPKKVPIPQIVKPHSKFAQYNVQTRFWGGNKYGNASGKRMGRAAQRGR